MWKIMIFKRQGQTESNDYHMQYKNVWEAYLFIKLNEKPVHLQHSYNGSTMRQVLFGGAKKLIIVVLHLQIFHFSECRN